MLNDIMTDSSLSEILDKIDMETYLDQQGITYKHSHGTSGPQLNLQVCPKCGGDKWKVFLNAETGLGNCFSGDCSEKFNKWKFISAHTDLLGKPLIDYIRNFGESLGWRAPRTKSAAVNLSTTELKIPTSYEIPIDGKNLTYLRNRNIDAKIAKYFNLRYCDKGWFKYIESGVEKFMKFDQRILIPIFDLDGNLVSFQGRDITGESPKKYLFPPEFAVTGKHLFNGHNVAATKRVLIGEGVFDVMAQKVALDQDESLRDVVPIGTFGKHLSEDQMERFGELKNRGVEQITFMWDSEVSATDAAIKAGLQLKKIYGLDIRVAQLPKGCDPNEVSTDVVRGAFYGALTLNKENAVRLMLSQRKM